MANITIFVGNSNKPITGGHHPACKIIWDDFDIGIHIGIHIHGRIRFMLKGSIMGKKQYGIMGFSLRHLLVNINQKNHGERPPPCHDWENENFISPGPWLQVRKLLVITRGESNMALGS